MSKMMKPLGGDRWHEINVSDEDREYYLAQGWKLANSETPVQRETRKYTRKEIPTDVRD